MSAQSMPLPRGRGVLLHPLAVLLLPVPAIIGVLFAQDVLFALACIAATLLVACARGARFTVRLLGMVLGGTAVLWCGFSLSLSGGTVTTDTVDWLPWQPNVDTTVTALRGALRLVTVLALYTVTVAFVRGDVLGDTLIARFRVPYRVVDVLSLGRRFLTLLGQDIRQVSSLVRLRARGRWLRRLRLSTRMTVPVLLSSLRHADQLSIAMEARGFGARPQRTVHECVPLRPSDGAVIGFVWLGTFVALGVWG